MQLSEFILPFSLAFIMFGIGTGLRKEDFTRVFIKPKAILTGLFSQLILLPIIAFAISFLWPLDPISKTGLVLIAACPGGSSSNVVTHLLKGRTALCVSLTALNSFIILISLPLIVALGLEVFMGEHHAVQMSFWDTMKNVTFTVLIPVIGGVIINHVYPDFADKTKKPLKIIMPLVLLLSFSYVLFFDTDNDGNSIEITNHLYLFLPAFILNIVSMTAGFYSGKVMKLKHDARFTFAIEVGLQNSALAIFIANQLLDNNSLAMVAIIYGSFSFFSTLIYAWWMKEKWTPITN